MPSLPIGHSSLNVNVIAQIRFTESYGLSLLQTHFGCFPLLFGGHEVSSA